MKKTLPIFIVIVIVVAGLSFYAGMKYDRSKNGAVSNTRGNFSNLTTEERQARMQQFGANFSDNGAVNGSRTARTGSNFAAGEIISRQDNLFTVRLSDGGSKNILISASTLITKSAVGSVDDLLIGKNIAVSGENNDDGSLTARTAQIRTELPGSAEKLPSAPASAM